MFTPTPVQQQQQHHLQILGNHPASPVACTFLDMPEDPFMPTRANLLFSESEYKQEYQEPVYENDSFMPYSTSPPAAEDCQASNEYIVSQRVKPEFSEDQFATLGAVSASMGSTYMMSMARSFSDSQLSDASSGMSSFDSSSSLSSQAGLAQATCQSSLGYGSQVVYSDDYYASARQHSVYSQQHSQHNYYHNQHRYSISSLPSLSQDSPLSSRSSFSSNSNLSLSSSTSSMASSYPLSRTLSEPSVPCFQSVNTLNSNGMVSVGNAATLTSGTPMIKPTPKRSRGRRVSCNPDTTGGKVFTCRFDDCGKVFKRSEHLKRHVRSIHTMEKPFECPIQNCPKRFSRSDNLNQHIRIHRHNGRGEKGKPFTAFTPFLQNYANELLSIS
ncbi:zf-C2H2 Zinc finger, C2H2 type [Haplosporangium sp. Z 767]|nr:zf-C2H2 Zinc finger, C2H2 type [Haplosporangium sp. Z 767]KAF9185627.1 zf-C2H2 Zinc finger, C2H2 type [Haplosporangium sp. Z 11]